MKGRWGSDRRWKVEVRVITLCGGVFWSPSSQLCSPNTSTNRLCLPCPAELSEGAVNVAGQRAQPTVLSRRTRDSWNRLSWGDKERTRQQHSLQLSHAQGSASLPGPALWPYYARQAPRPTQTRPWGPTLKVIRATPVLSLIYRTQLFWIEAQGFVFNISSLSFKIC